MNTYDAIVIGSGIGGLSCAAALSHIGRRVLVLEQHPTLGGSLQPFEHGPWAWSFGLTYILNWGEDSPDYLALSRLTDGQVAFARLPDAFQHVRMPDIDLEFDWVSDSGLMKQRLLEMFPAEKAGIETYWSYLDEVDRYTERLVIPKLLPRWASGTIASLVGRPLRKYMTTPYLEVLDDLFEDEHLKRIFKCLWSVVGDLDHAFIYYGIVNVMMFKGVFHPIGKSDAIVQALKSTIEKGGGQLLPGTRVSELSFDGARVNGVVTAKGETYRSDKVISGIGLPATMSQLIPESRQPQALVDAVANIESSASVVALDIGFEGDLSSFGIERKVYRTCEQDSWGMHDDPTREGWRPLDTNLCFPSMLDTGHEDTAHHCAELSTVTKGEYFTKYLPMGGEDYRAAKERITAALLEQLEARFPGIGEHIAYTHLTTPYSIEKQLLREQGGIYGLKVDAIPNMDIVPQSGIKGLYLTGQDVLFHGVTLLNGVLTASVVSRKNLLGVLMK